MVTKSKRKIFSEDRHAVLKSLGARLRKARIDAGLTQIDAASRINVSAQTVGNWESGRNAPDATAISSLAVLYGVPSEQMTNAVDDPLVSPDVLLPYNRVQVDLDRLVSARQNAGLTQTQAADLSGISANSIGRYETGLAKPMLHTMKILAAAYEKQISWFLPQQAEPEPIACDNPDQTPHDAALIAYDAVREDLPDEGVALIADFIYFVHQRFHKPEPVQEMPVDELSPNQE